MARRSASDGGQGVQRTSSSRRPRRREVVRLDAAFAAEYPGADPRATEAMVAAIVAGQALIGELGRRIEHTLGVSEPVLNALAVIDGADEALTPSQIGERTLISSATMTAVLDVLEDRGWIQRTPNPADRRSVLIQITPEGRATADRVLPGIHAVERRLMDSLTKAEAIQLVNLLEKVIDRANELADEDPEPLAGDRRRPSG